MSDDLLAIIRALREAHAAIAPETAALVESIRPDADLGPSDVVKLARIIKVEADDFRRRMADPLAEIARVRELLDGATRGWAAERRERDEARAQVARLRGAVEWLDVPPHGGFWWRYDGHRTPEVVVVRILPEGYVWVADTHGNFGLQIADAKWFAIDVPAAPTEAP